MYIVKIKKQIIINARISWAYAVKTKNNINIHSCKIYNLFISSFFFKLILERIKPTALYMTVHVTIFIKSKSTCSTQK